MTVWRRVVLLVLALVLLNTVLLLPAYPSQLTVGHFLAIAIELPVLAAILLITPRSAGRWVALLLTTVVVLSAFLSAANILTQISLGRFFKPMVDGPLLAAGWDVLSGALGEAQALIAVIASLSAFILLAVATALAVARLGRIGLAWRPGGRLGAAALPALVAGGLLAVDAGRGNGLPVGHEAIDRIAFHTRQIAGDLATRQAFADALAADPVIDLPADTLFSRLEGRDVIMLFVESYGRTAIEDPRYRPVVAPALAALDGALASRGATAVSGWLTSPTAGGQSWLAHGSLLSGLWLDTQRRYDQLVTSDRRTLVHLLADAGWRTAAVMPALTLAWPEGSFFGYDRLYAAGDLGYRGAPYNWVTMPDQYTLTALDRLELTGGPRPPVFAEVALISSHAPWTPIAPIIDWEDVGDGSVFSQWADLGDPPAVLWRDFDRVREHYALATAYSISVIARYVEERLDPDDLLIVLGDHQPAPLVTGEGASRAVPMHIVAGDPELLDAIVHWGWTPGIMPAADAPEWRMDAFRERFVTAFSDAAHVVAGVDGTESVETLR